MTLIYTLDENDFLAHQLYTASKSERIKAQRMRTWIIYSFVVLILSFLFYVSGNRFLTYYFLFFGLFILFFFPFYQRRYYKNHYRKFVEETFKNRCGEQATVKILENSIETSDITGESKINLLVIEEIEETGEYFYIKMRTAERLIIPKAKIESVDQVKVELQNLAKKQNVSYVSDLTWRWK